ncbi:MAG: cell division protein FtsZ [candidate division WOR-3 bacterium]
MGSEIKKPEIKIGVFGLGSGGGNIINHMIEEGIKGVEFYAINTDRQMLNFSLAPNKIQIGTSLTGGFGSGDDPEIGRKACLESEEVLRDIATGVDLAFLVACLGGGTGSGASSFLAKILKEAGALVVAIVTKPFRYEGEFRMRRALKALAELRSHIDARMVLANDQIIEHYGNRFFGDAFRSINSLITEAVKGVIDMLNTPQIINIDFADFRSVMAEKGLSAMSVGIGMGENRARLAAENVLNSPFLDTADLRGCKKVLINVTGDEKLTMREVQVACNTITECLSPKTLIRCGYGKDKNLKDKMKITMVASGMEEKLDNYLDIDGIIKDLENVMPVRRNGKIDLENREIPAFLRLRAKVD